MNEFTAWIQSNWYALGNLLSQIAFLSAGVWFAQKILKTIRASQEQIGALLKLSITGTERQLSATVQERSFSSASPYWLMPGEKVLEASSSPLTEPGPSRWAIVGTKLTAAGTSLVVWLQTPMGGNGTGTWRKAMRWLQSPAGS